MRWITWTLAATLACTPLLAAEEKTDERLNNAATLFNEVMGTRDRTIPQGLLDRSYCVVVVPGLKKAAVLVGGKYGRGYAVCRSANGQGWGPPAAIRVEGGSFGAQVGFASSDVVLLIMNSGGMRRLTKSKFTIGAEATAAAGPVGRDASAQTDGFVTAEILSWSRSRGLFGGVSLDGATLRSDVDENQAIYGQRWTSKDILTSGAKPIAAADKLLEVLSKYSPRRVG
jgi:lipid-binding SYLF domain-containing protein